DAVGTRGTGSGQCIVGAAQTVLNGQVAGYHVDDGAGHEERRYASRTTAQQQSVVLLDIGQTADTRPHGNADAITIGIGDLQPGLVQRTDSGGYAVMDEQVQLAGFLAGHVELVIEITDGTTGAAVQRTDVHVFDRPEAALARNGGLPADFNRM